MAESERIDKVLWSLRIFKTRTEATDACKGGKVKVGGTNAKPSREIKPGDVVNVHKGIIQFSYRIKAIPPHRLGAKLVPDYAENLTPQSELDKVHAPVETFFLKRDRGSGRPTKKQRREMEDAWDKIDIAMQYDNDDDEDI
ncbi:MAG: RNA-binding S4 domain-containing protein [Bacteroidales bacterium]|nr:RNA-binding S4 domain-containing protein [Bacteroidales bacterium]